MIFQYEARQYDIGIYMITRFQYWYLIILILVFTYPIIFQYEVRQYDIGIYIPHNGLRHSNIGI